MDDDRRKEANKIRRDALEERTKKLERLRAEKAKKEADQASGTGGRQEGSERKGKRTPSKRREDRASRNPRKPKPAPAAAEINIDDVVQNLLSSADLKAPAPSSEQIAEREKHLRDSKMAALASQHNVVNINIPSKEVPTYDRGVQASGVDAQTPRTAVSFAGMAPEPTVDRPDVAADDDVAEASAVFDPQAGFLVPEMSKKEKDAVMGSQEFGAFFSKASRVVERAMVLDERMGRYDFTVDYNKDESKDVGEDEVVQKVCSFFDETLCKHRAVTDVSFSPKHPELVLVSYSGRHSSTTEEGEEGLVILWNVMTPSTPEMVFFCGSFVLRAFISHFNSNLVIASTYGGQIVVWDKSIPAPDHRYKVPTSKTPLSPSGHTFPVYSMELVGTDNANSLITVSTDGVMRSWNPVDLSEPQDTKINLFYPKEFREWVSGQPLAATCTAFVDGDASSCFVGSEDGTMFAVQRDSGMANPIADSYVGHDGPITGVSCHPASATGDVSGIVLSCSMDWKIKLWDRKRAHSLHTMEDSNDCVYDVKWSPTHPSVFASVNGEGVMSVWNLNLELEQPVSKVVVSTDRALNRVQWSKDGKRLAAGTSNGQCFIYDAYKELYVSSGQDFRQFGQVLYELQGKAKITWDMMRKQDYITTKAIAEALKNNKTFKRIIEIESKSSNTRDQQDNNQKVEERVKSSASTDVFTKEVEERTDKLPQIDLSTVLTFQAVDQVRNSLGNAVDSGCVVLLQGCTDDALVWELADALPNSYVWSLDNVFRALTLLATKALDGHKKGYSKELLTKDLLGSLTKELSMGKHNGSYDIEVNGKIQSRVADLEKHLRTDTINANLGAMLDKGYGDVLRFSIVAFEKLTSDGVNVIVYGQTAALKYIPSPFRFNVFLSDPFLAGRRVVCERIVAHVMGQENLDTGDDETVMPQVIGALNQLAQTIGDDR